MQERETIAHDALADAARSRLRRVIGEEGIARLGAARVFVLGLGGVGSACAEALVRAGIGSFLFVDKDAVEPSNLNRQAIAFLSTLGMRKVEAMRTMAHDIAPNAEVETLDAFVREEDVDELLAPFRQPDFIVDALDTLTAKAAIARYAQNASIPLVSSMGMANRTDPTKLRFARLEDTQGCPFCREMRKIARTRGLSRMDVLYSTERPLKVEPTPGAARSEKTELGTFSYMPPVAGQMIAGYVIQALLGSPLLAEGEQH